MTAARVARLPAFALVLFAFLAAPRASAGPYTDALGKCFVDKTTTADRTVLVQWMVAMMTLHPDVENLSRVTPEVRTQITKKTAGILQRLLTEDCATQAREAFTYEGRSTFEAAGNMLGQVAARELFMHPKVKEGPKELAKYIDASKIEAVKASPIADKPAKP